MDPIPTKVPVVPKPTLTVDIPTKFWDKDATYRSWSCGKDKDLVPSKTVIWDPPLDEYLTFSPVCNWWLGRKIDWWGTNTCVAPKPGNEKVIVVPMPGIADVPTPTDSLGSK